MVKRNLPSDSRIREQTARFCSLPSWLLSAVLTADARMLTPYAGLTDPRKPRARLIRMGELAVLIKPPAPQCLRDPLRTFPPFAHLRDLPHRGPLLIHSSAVGV